MQKRRARRKQRRRTNKTVVRKVVQYLPRNKAGDIRYFGSGAQPAQFYKAAVRTVLGHKGKQVILEANVFLLVRWLKYLLVVSDQCKTLRSSFSILPLPDSCHMLKLPLPDSCHVLKAASAEASIRISWISWLQAAGRRSRKAQEVEPEDEALPQVANLRDVALTRYFLM